MLLFAFFHHVLPGITAPRIQISETEKLVDAGAVQSAELDIESADAQNRFTQETHLSESAYSSKDICIELSTSQYLTPEGEPVVYHVADIYVNNIECLKTAIANDAYQRYGSEYMLNMDKRVGAICAMSGDYLTYNSSNIIIRNGQLIRDSWGTWGSLCVLYYDGTMECYDDNNPADLDYIRKSNPWQSWSFGPVLLDDKGDVIEQYSMVSNILSRNPRAAIGYYEPGHYCFVVVDGRADESAGALLPELGQIFKDLGCTKAYNFDGGGSAVMTFNHEPYSVQSSPDRKLGDIVYIAEVDQ